MKPASEVMNNGYERKMGISKETTRESLERGKMSFPIKKNKKKCFIALEVIINSFFS